MLSRSAQSARLSGNGGLFNFGADFPASNRSLRRWRAGRARVRNATLVAGNYASAASPTIACLGDSNTRGLHSGDGTVPKAGYNGWPVKLAKLLTDRGIKAQCENWFATGGITTGTVFGNDDRITVSASGVSVPATGSGLTTVGGSSLQFTAAGGTVTFQTKTPCTQCDLYMITANNTQSISWAVDGGSATTLSTQTGATQLSKFTIGLGSLATHSIVLTGVSGTPYLAGMDCYDATTPLVHVLNWGWSGSTSAQWVPAGSSAWLPPVAIQNFYKPDLIIGPVLGTNDINTSNNFTVAQHAAYMTTLLGACTASSDVLMLTMGPSGATTSPNAAAQKAIVDADYALALQFGLPLIDEFAAMGSDQAFAEALGLYNTSDHIHKTAAGHFATAELVLNALLAV